MWKKEFSPCENELATLRRGEEWDPVRFQQEREQREWREKLEAERSRALNKVSQQSYIAPSGYQKVNMSIMSGTHSF